MKKSIKKKNTRPVMLDTVMLKLCKALATRYRLQHFMTMSIPIKANRGFINILA